MLNRNKELSETLRYTQYFTPISKNRVGNRSDDSSLLSQKIPLVEHLKIFSFEADCR